jgi:hypothetical protein
MKADAIRRARQMHSRTAFTQKPFPEPTVAAKPQGVALDSILNMTNMLGLSNDQAILFGLILLLSGQKENIPLIIALLYIAM